MSTGAPVAFVMEDHLSAGVRDRLFSGAAAVARIGRTRVDTGVTVGSCVVGTTSDEPTAPPVIEGTLFDIASITKAFFAVVTMRLIGRGLLALDTPVASLVPAFPGTATLADLLAHRAGLSDWQPLYRELAPEEVATPEGRARIRALAASRAGPPTIEPRYSDLGYIVLGELLERASGLDLAALLDREVCAPLGSSEVTFRPDPSIRVAATERCPWRGRLLCGEVHDENAYAMGGVSAHAGLFATARAVAAFGAAVLDDLSGAERLLARPLALEMLRPRPGGTWRLGWDGKSPEGSTPGSTAGRRFGPDSFGHLGFTGCSLWIDPDALLVVSLLTNRVHPSRQGDRAEAFRSFRPAFHDAVAEAIGGRVR